MFHRSTLLPFSQTGRVFLGLTVLATGTVALSLVLSGAFQRASAQTRPFTPREVLTSDPNVSFLDPEFDQRNAKFTWVDKQGNLWVSSLDPITGAFVPYNGQEILVDTNAGTVGDPGLGNGPEWAFSSTGSRVVYTKKGASRLSYSLKQARFDGTTWVGEPLVNGENAGGPIGSIDYNDPKPLITYAARDPVSGLPTGARWREIDDAAVDGPIPEYAPPGGRWVAGRRALVYPRLVGDTQQIFYLDVTTGVATQITFDGGQKITPYAWQAPEFRGGLALATVIDNTFVGIYRQEANGTWTRTYTIDLPSPKPYIGSIEFFVFNGKSYISVLASDNPDPQSLNALTDCWVAGIDAAAPFYRQVTEGFDAKRRDPEVFIARQGPYIYYLREGSIYRAWTGLSVTSTTSQ